MRNPINHLRAGSFQSVIVSVSAVFAIGAMSSVNARAEGLTELKIAKPKQTVRQTIQLDKTTETSSLGDINTAGAEPDYSAAPVLVTVSLSNQQMNVYKGLSSSLRTRISSGKSGHASPTGIFSILEKRRYHESNLYSDAPMPFMQRLTWSGIALHEGRVPPFPASHGCIRIPKGSAKTVFGMTQTGIHVVLSDEEISPRPLLHHALFQPVEKNDLVASLRPVISEIRLNETSDSNEAGNDAPLRIYATRTTRRDSVRNMQQMLNKAGYPVGEPDGIYGTNTVRAVKAFQQLAGYRVTGTATSETVQKLRMLTGSAPLPDGKLFVRQSHTPIFDTDIAIKKPSEPLGTHLAYIGRLTAEKAGWLSVSMATRLKKSTIRDHGMDAIYGKQKVSVNIRRTLDRLEIPQEARAFIEERLTPGTSFAISDNGLGTETGKGTDFIVQTF